MRDIGHISTCVVRMPTRANQAGAFADIVAQFGAKVTPKLRAGVGHGEAQLRDPFASLLADAGVAIGLEVLTIDETPLDVLGVRPDFMVHAAGAKVGFAELKARGRKVPTIWTPTTRERGQWGKLRLLPNVLYSDGEHYAVYHFGELSGTVAQLDGDLRTAGSALRPLDSQFERVITEFLLWEPEPPRSVGQLVHAIANLCRLLRDEVRTTLDREQRWEEPEPIFSPLAADWREYLFPGLPDADFADAYAQTVTFALLLARADGISFEAHELPEIARQLSRRHSLMGKALDVLTERSVERRSVALGTLLRVVGAVDWDDLNKRNADVYLRLYEHFLEEYDAELRRRSGSYYTPNEVVAFMTRFTDEILRRRMRIRWGLASKDVRIIDPAMGTGTYLLNVIDSVARIITEEEGDKAVPPQLRALFGRLVGFERQTCPYAVAGLRIHQALRTYHAWVPDNEMQFFVADTLDDPNLEQAHIPATLEPIARSRREANKIKLRTPIDLVIGNPPYGERARGLGGWIETGDQGHLPPLDAFRATGRGKYENVLSNLYVYFWRWATWKAFDAHHTHPEGIVALITPSSFTTGIGYAGMREYLRRTADEGWIIDLSPEEFRSESGMRVFPGVQHKLCIAIFARYGPPSSDTPACIHYLAIAGSQAAKFRALTTLGIDRAGWSSCRTGWHDLLIPAGGLDWHQFPALGDLMPWSHAGVTPNRNWVHAPDGSTLRRRWARLIHADPDEKPGLLKQTRDRTMASTPPQLPGVYGTMKPLGQETSTDVRLERVALRSFDRQYLIYDARVVDFARRPLWQVRGDSQVYVTEQHAHPIEAGPGLTFAAYVPGVDHFNGRGGRALPLYRDSAGLIPNVAPGLLQAIADRLKTAVTAEDVLAYIAGVVAHHAYIERFTEELRAPGIRVPLTADPLLWAEAVHLGRTVLWLHTYGERFTDPADGRPGGPPRLPRDRRPQVTATIPDTEEGMPEEISYDLATQTLYVGTGQIRPVPWRVWGYEVSGMRVVRKWFDYRKKNPRVRWSSPLDNYHTERWPPSFTSELLDLLNVLTLCTDLEVRQADLLDRLCGGQLITVAELEYARVLPVPARSRKPPALEDPETPTLFRLSDIP
jgi:Type ISP C-terminal specificity domain/N-6 DNA Methylase